MSRVPMLFCAAALAVFSAAAFADDPALSQDGNSCATSGGFCGSSTEAVDPNTGIDTLKYIFATGGTGIIPTTGGDWNGWVEGLNGVGGPVGELLDFVKTGSGATAQYAVFLYCGGTTPGICSAQDDVLPSYEEANSKGTFVVNNSPYNSLNSTTLPGGGTYNSGNAEYEVITNTCTSAAGLCNLVGTVKASAPEPSSVLLLGFMLIPLTTLVRRKFFARA